MNKDTKRFEEWEDVDCNQCENYYTNSCDGVPEGKKRPCNAFKAQRGIVIPEKIKRLENSLKSLQRQVFWLNIAVILGAIAGLIHLFS